MISTSCLEFSITPGKTGVRYIGEHSDAMVFYKADDIQEGRILIKYIAGLNLFMLLIT
jgi:hypothetical protein